MWYDVCCMAVILEVCFCSSVSHIFRWIPCLFLDYECNVSEGYLFSLLPAMHIWNTATIFDFYVSVFWMASHGLHTCIFLCIYTVQGLVKQFCKLLWHTVVVADFPLLSCEIWSDFCCKFIFHLEVSPLPERCYYCPQLWKVLKKALWNCMLS